MEGWREREGSLAQLLPEPRVPSGTWMQHKGLSGSQQRDLKLLTLEGSRREGEKRGLQKRGGRGLQMGTSRSLGTDPACRKVLLIQSRKHMIWGEKN